MFESLKLKILGARKSFTIWFNTLAGAVLFNMPMLQMSFPQMQDYLPHNIYQYSMGLIVVVNIFLRFKTNDSLENK
jgi:hypothetical protein